MKTFSSETFPANEFCFHHQSDSSGTQVCLFHKTVPVLPENHQAKLETHSFGSKHFFLIFKTEHNGLFLIKKRTHCQDFSLTEVYRLNTTNLLSFDLRKLD